MSAEEIADIHENHTVNKEHYRGLFAEPSVGVKFNCAGKRANVGLAYALDGVLDRTTDAYIRRNYPQFRLKFGVEF